MKKTSRISILNRQNSDKNYPREAFKFLFRVEPRHFWFIGRNYILNNFVRQFYQSTVGKSFLEVGCGTGFVLAAMEKLGFTVTGIDMHLGALRHASKRTNASLIHTDLEHYKNYKQFDVVGVFDVVEHVKNDTRFIRQCRKLLIEQGTLLLTVPAGMELWSDFDILSGHKRRYTKTSLLRLLESNGFKVTFISYFGFFQYLPHIIAKKFLYKEIPRDDNELAPVKHLLEPPPPVVNTILKWSLIIESKLMSIMSFPFGTSIIVVAQKVV